MITVNKAFNVGLLKVKYRQKLDETWKEIVEPYLLSHFVAVLTAGLGVLALVTYGPAAAVVMIAGSVGSQALAHRSRDRALENQELRELVVKVAPAFQAHMEMAQNLAKQLATK